MLRIAARYRESGVAGTLSWGVSKSRAWLVGRAVKAAAFGNAASRRILGGMIPAHPPAPDVTYVLVFLGEFGYELLNWQGVVRKFAATLPPSARLVVAGRAGLRPFYESVHEYVDISKCEAFRSSVAAAYFAIPPGRDRRAYPQTDEERDFDRALRREIEDYVRERLQTGSRPLAFIFSSNLTVFPGCIFGADWKYYGSRGYPGRIYSDMAFLTRNNRYVRIEPDPSVRRRVEDKVGFPLSEPFMLVQSRSRDIGPQAGVRIDEAPVLRRLSSLMRVVTLSFDTGRHNDSRSRLCAEGARITPVAASSFEEQSWLISAARRCVFITEGDLGSHTYLPPLMGRDVHIIASQEVFSMPSAPIAEWNDAIFRFGGQMHRLPWEELSADRSGQWLRKALALGD